MRTSKFLDRRIQKMNQNLEKRIEAVETASSFMLNNQYSAIETMMNRLREMN